MQILTQQQRQSWAPLQVVTLLCLWLEVSKASLIFQPAEQLSSLQADSAISCTDLLLEFFDPTGAADGSTVLPKLAEAISFQFHPLSGSVFFLEKQQDRLIYRYEGEFPSIAWERDALVTRTRSNMMNKHHGVLFESLPHVELVACSSAQLNYEWAHSGKPNLLFLMSDDQGYYDAGWHRDSEFLRSQGEFPSPTPHLDELRKESVEVMYFYTYPTCSPSRATIMTGRMSFRHGYGPSVNPGWTNQLSGRETMWTEILKGAGGYYNVGMGKWHLGMNDWRTTPLFRGFDTYMGPFNLDWTRRWEELDTCSLENQLMYFHPAWTTARGTTLFNATQTQDVESWAGRSDLPVYSADAMPNIETVHHNEIIRQEQKRILAGFVRSESRRKPLLYYSSSKLPHTPLAAPAGYDYPNFSTACTNGKTENRHTYLKMLYAMDVQFHELVQELQKIGFWKDTVMIFMSDNTGLATPSGGACNRPLQGRKNLVWDQRVVNLFHGSASTLAALDLDALGSENYDLMHAADLFPTILTGIAKIPKEDYKNAWKCSTCIPFLENEIDGMNQWHSIKTRNGVDHIGTTTRTFVTHLVSQDQIALQTGDLSVIEKILPRHAYDEEFWAMSDFSDAVVGLKCDIEDVAAHVNEIAISFGTGYIQRGRYSIFFHENTDLDGDPSLNPSKRKSLSSNTDNPVSIASFLAKFDDLPSRIPGQMHDLAYMHDVLDDPMRVNNLFSRGLSNEETSAAYEMLKYYLWEQTPERHVIDSKLLYLWVVDPAMIRKVRETGIVQPFCDISIICNNDMPVALTKNNTGYRGNESFLHTQSPTLRPTSNPTTARPTTPFPTRRPTTARPTKAPTTARPTKTPTSRPTRRRGTSRPTKSPTARPTARPTTSRPTKSPTSRPTVRPTKSPTHRPTARRISRCSTRRTVCTSYY